MTHLMKRHLPVVVAAAGVLGWSALAGCRALPEPVCESDLLVAARTASGPRTLKLGQTATYALTYNAGTTCGQFGRFVNNTIDSTGAGTGRTTRQVAVQAHYAGCSCAADTLSTAQATYEFKPWRAGTFVLQFLTRRSQFISDTLTVR